MPRHIDDKNPDAALKRIKLAQENIKLAQLKEKIAEDKEDNAPREHTPYAEIPPPNEEEMRGVQDRLNAIYNRIRAANEDTKRQFLLSIAKDWP